ncbi:MAG: S8 family serine peptidase [Sedimentisphaerales bacterium]|nr:S8 family serine peptidase [Sedimentisphaerales bacterium]
MKRQILIISLTLLFIAAFAMAETSPYKPGVLLVRFANPAAATQTKNSILSTALGCSCSPIVKEYSIVPGLALIQLPSGTTVEQARVSLMQSSDILYAEPDYKRELCAVPNDTRFSELWAMHNTGQAGGTADADIDAPEAWNINTGSNNIVVAVTDTGADYLHHDLAANMWENPGEIPDNGIDDDSDTYTDDIYGVDTGDNDGDPMDDSAAAGHGTHVSGTIGAVGNNVSGVAGVCWHVSIMAVKIADSDGGLSDSAAISGIQYAIDKGAKVINASWGGYGYSQSLYDVIANARNAGVIFVAAAGNGYPNNSGIPNNNDDIPFYPASYTLDNIISVMATSDTDVQASYTNYGLTSVDIAAPGGDQSFGEDRGILSTVPDNSYEYYQGTSMAAPHVTGACALLLSADPDMTYTEVKQHLLDRSDPLPSLSGFCVSGGRLNLYKVLYEATNDTTPPSPDPAEWELAPQATGLQTIAMKAAKATDHSGIEYFFGCVEDSNFDSDWQDSPLYNRDGFSENTAYTFRVKYRDKSGGHNETEWSDPCSTTTASGSDNLPPFPNPSRWESKPRVLRLLPTPRVRMEAVASYDETGTVMYKFTCIDVNPVVPDPNVFSSGWQESRIYTISSGLTMDTTYTFKVNAKDVASNVTIDDPNFNQASVTIGTQAGNTLTVPSPYKTIQAAINASGDGDVVEVRPGIYTGPGNYNLDFRYLPPHPPGTRAITVRSINPNDPNVVAATIIDVELAELYRQLGGGPAVRDFFHFLFGMNIAYRGFIFQSNESSDSIVAGFTIKNGFISSVSGTGGDRNGVTGSNEGGGAILCGSASNPATPGGSPTIRNCVITGCIVFGGDGGPGAPGIPRDPSDPNSSDIPGGYGGAGADGMGGAIYGSSNSHPAIIDCTISDCYAFGGNGGDGGNGEIAIPPDGTGGNADDGGNGLGGGIYCASSAVISNCTVANSITYPGDGGLGGDGDTPGADGVPGAASHGGGIYYNTNYAEDTTNSRITGNWAYHNGGGIYCLANSKPVLTGCLISGNSCDGAGAGIFYERGLSLTLHNCTISDNIVDSTNDGGGIYAGHLSFDTTVTIDDNSTISGNTAGFGAGLFLIRTNLTVDDSIIRDNDADVEGAGLFAYNCTANINNCTVKDNSAILGGGLSIIMGLATINNSVFTGNSADGPGGTGGALFFEGWSDYPHKVNNCLITDNTALADGGGVSNNAGAWVQLTNCTLANNMVTSGDGAGGGLICAEYEAWAELINSIVWDNSANYGPQISVGTPFGSNPFGPDAFVDVNYSDVKGGEDDVFLEDPDYTDLWWMPGSTEADPLFAQPTTEQTYFLSQIAAGQLVDSPCVDTGLGGASALASLIGMPLTTRTDYVADTGIVDMGYHYKAGLGVVNKYQLTIEVIDRGYGAFGTVEANIPPMTPPIKISGTFDVNQGRVVDLHADPNTDWEVLQWTGTDYLPVHPADRNYNTVTMNSHKTVTVEFGPHNAFKLITHVIGDGVLKYIDPNGDTVAHPGQTIHPPDTIVSLVAVSYNPSEVIIWTGTDDDFSDSVNNSVTMNAHKEVSVQFYSPRILYVPGDYPSIQLAIDAASDRDIVEISSAPQPYYTHLGFTINGKAVTITSSNPDDPCCVANTIIETDYNTPATGVGPIFFFNNVGRNTVLNGLTIRGYNAYGGFGGNGTACGEPGGNGGWISGGGISCGYVEGFGGNASPTIKNCVIADCTILGGDGGNGFAGCQDHPEGGEGGWPGRAYGAGAGIFNNSSPVFINCTFRNNVATGGLGGNGGNGNPTPPGPWGPGGPGGGWYYGEGSLWYNHDWPYGPYDLYTEYTGRGGAVYVGQGCNPEFIDCNFIDNRSFGGRNGICGVDGAPVSGIREPSIRYKIDNFGGAVYVAGTSTAQFVGCVFSGNSADINNVPASSDAFVSYGGAIAFEDGADILIEQCTFSDNVAAIGGGLYWSWSDPQIKDCNFIGNLAYHGGGALSVGGKAIVTASNFNANEATAIAGRGAGICFLGTNAEIVDCTISNNDANGSGGGIYISNKNINGEQIAGENTVLVKNCLIAGNFASRDGGGISANWHSDPNIVNCTIVNNAVTGTGVGTGYGGGLGCFYGNYTNVVNCIFRSNSAQRGPQIAIGTGFEYFKLPSTVNVSYSDVQSGQSYVFVDEDCTLNWNAGNIHINPLFVTGPLGDFYLSQIAAGNLQNSPCVNTGSASAASLGLDNYTTRTDQKPDLETVDMGYHYPFTPEEQPCRFCELVRDGIINFRDFAVFVLNWLDEGCNPANNWCQYSDITFDTYVDFRDVELFARCWLVEDTYTPTPNPSEWETEPHSSEISPNSISMAAVTAVDAWDYWGGNVQYYFDCVYGGCQDSGWQNSNSYTDPNLLPGEEYGYKVRARDASEKIPAGDTAPGNKTGWSPVRYAIVGEKKPDFTPPEPNKMTWAIPPTAIDATTITMTATTATDENGPIEYFFECTTDATASSNWQTGTTYIAADLTPETLYIFKVKAHDGSPAHNETDWSDDASATTPEEEEPNEPNNPPLDTEGPLPDPPQWAEGGQPTQTFGSGWYNGVYYQNYYWHTMTAVPASDAGRGDSEPCMYYFDLESGGVGPHDSGWQLSNVYTYPVSAINANQYGYYRVRTRDAADNETDGWSTTLNTHGF